MMLVAGPPVEVQVKVLDCLSYLRLVTTGEPNKDWQMMTVTPNCIRSVKRMYRSVTGLKVMLLLKFRRNKNSRALK